MANPSPVYIVSYSGQQIPGYTQREDLPFPIRVARNDILGRAGGTMAWGNAGLRDFTIRMRVLSRLSAGTGLDHLNDCKTQYRSALAIVSRVSSSAALYVGETDRYINALCTNISAPQEAPDSRRITYDLSFTAANPYFIGTAVSTSATVSGDTTLSLNIGDTSRAYPVITIPTGITAITVTDNSGTGRGFSLSGTHASSWVVDCGTLQITSGGSNAVSALTTGPNFGIYHINSGTLYLDVTGVTGSGDVSVTMTPRYER